MSLEIDDLTLSNFTLRLDPTFGKLELEANPENEDTGLLTATFELDGKQFEYQEWYSVSNAKVETEDTLLDDNTAPSAVRLYEYARTLRKQRRSRRFITELNKHIESQIGVTDKTDRFEKSLAVMKLSQNAVCKHLGVTPQGVIKWKKSGNFPNWIWFALRGLAAELGRPQPQ